jgi:hypothetical protein
LRGKGRLQGVRQAIEQMAADGSSLDEISTAIVDSTAGLDAERRAALWLYARSCTEAAGPEVEARAPVATERGRVHAAGRPSEPGGTKVRRRGRGDMPYVSCPNCGLTTYATRGRWEANECPGCGEALLSDDLAVDAPAGARFGAVAGALELAREQLDMDVALLTEIADGHETVRDEAGEWPPLESLKEGSIAVEETFCNALLEGRISNVVPDASADERVRHLSMARDFGVGSWIGVPLAVSDARLYMLCCLAREARPALGEADVRFLAGLAETVRADLEPEPG